MKSFSDLRIVFMGTPEFAVASLRALVAAGGNIVGVITAPDKPAGRGLHLQQSAVKKYAIENALHVLQPEKLKNPEFLAELKALQVDIQIVVAFRMLPELVWNMPPMGTINLHGSLLPQYRGAAPINWAVINGDAATGVTTFKLQHEIDTGNILLQESFPIGENETAGEVHDRMMVIGAQLLVRTVKGLAEGRLEERPQNEISNVELSMSNGEISNVELSMSNGEISNVELSMANGEISNVELSMANVEKLEGAEIKNKELEIRNEEVGNLQPSTFNLQPSTFLHAPKIFTETCKIDFSKTVGEVHNLIRGLSPFPGAFTHLDGKLLKIYRSEKIINPAFKYKPDKPFESDGKTYLRFFCDGGAIEVKELQIEGKKKMGVEDFLRGYRMSDL